MSGFWRWVKTEIADDSMSIALFGLFALCVLGQGATGWRAYDAARQAAGLRGVPLKDYLATGTFLDGLFSNWQAAILQLAVLIAFGSVLRQRGAAHTRPPPAQARRTIKWKFRPHSTLQGWIFANSLSLAFLGLFAATFVMHLIFGTWRYNEEQLMRHLPPEPIGAYARSADFWFSAFECWEAEFFAIGLYIVLSIFLRQEGSPESKPVEARNDEDGDAGA